MHTCGGSSLISISFLALLGPHTDADMRYFTTYQDGISHYSA